MPNSKKHCLDCDKEMSERSEHELCGDCRRDRAYYMPSKERIARMTAQFRQQRLNEILEASPPKIYHTPQMSRKSFSSDE